MTNIKGIMIIVLTLTAVFALTAHLNRTHTVFGVNSISNHMITDVNPDTEKSVFIKSINKPTQIDTLKINEFRVDIGQVEIINELEVSQDLTLVTLNTSTDSFEFSGTINSNEHRLIDITLLEEGDTIALMQGDVVIDEVSYGTMGRAPQPVNNTSVARLDDTDDDAVDWNLDLTPTMGSENDVPGVALGSSPVYLTEVYIDPGSGFIEMKNHGEGAINITDWFIVVDDIYNITTPTVLNSSVLWVLDDIDYPVNMSINASADNIYLYNSTGSRLDQMGWNNATNNFPSYSWNRLEGNLQYVAFNGYSNSTSKLIPCSTTRNISNIYLQLPTGTFGISFAASKVYYDTSTDSVLSFRVRGGIDEVTKIYGLSWTYNFERESNDMIYTNQTHEHPGEEILYVGDSKAFIYYDNLTSRNNTNYRAVWQFQVNGSEVTRLEMQQLHRFDVWADLHVAGAYLARERSFLTFTVSDPNLLIAGPNPIIQYPYDRPMVLGTISAVREIILDDGENRDFYFIIENDNDSDTDGSITIENLTVKLDIPEDAASVVEYTGGDLVKSYGDLLLEDSVMFNFSVKAVKPGKAMIYLRFESDNPLLAISKPLLIIEVVVYPLWNPFHWTTPTAPIFWVIFISIPVIIFGGRYLILRSRKRKAGFEDIEFD
ncbi:MAG: lamin tail domain-containing protein [Candidatus Odinarchaeota archaeon]